MAVEPDDAALDAAIGRLAKERRWSKLQLRAEDVDGFATRQGKVKTAKEVIALYAVRLDRVALVLTVTVAAADEASLWPDVERIVSSFTFAGMLRIPKLGSLQVATGDEKR